MVTHGTEFSDPTGWKVLHNSSASYQVCRIPIHAELSSSTQSASAGVVPVRGKNERYRSMNFRARLLILFSQRMQPKSIEDWLVNCVVTSDSGGTIIEYDAAAGNGFCVGCGTIVEENAIVSEVVFGESSSDAAIVQGSFTTAIRMYTLALEHKFTKGRTNMDVIAVCLYIACRQKETRNYMLIDFSDLLQVNVFELGHTFLQLVQTLNLRLPLVDPSHYISRFAALLESGDETLKVAADAARLVARFDRDWMSRGRRPVGICGSSL
ncbi:uncharacterized protein FOMMEDRAFT_159269 [Fomitiporia mediterranea MF3/22]|uniref:uncharacterized protein n=1 Tax=Fomitiporia mediterranea (strain MF3/22) TaxID=694068 RepID=UPI000440857B|nr:uncharacterized protein FOMMEDRAFT_159269 [Fomitiporia mediterranea MF3/22]EJD00535.1 hypothetical protein FOMMEDRAFT_159269 [Fomitiporia mediterranea MF3/22]